MNARHLLFVMNSSAWVQLRKELEISGLPFSVGHYTFAFECPIFISTSFISTRPCSYIATYFVRRLACGIWCLCCDDHCAKGQSDVFTIDTHPFLRRSMSSRGPWSFSHKKKLNKYVKHSHSLLSWFRSVMRVKICIAGFYINTCVLVRSKYQFLLFTSSRFDAIPQTPNFFTECSF